MHFISIKTKPILPPKDDILKDLLQLKLSEKDIICITSKVLAIHQGRCKKIGDIDKKVLVKNEADKILSEVKFNNTHFYLTIKNNIIIASSGIDESNGDGYYILWPEKVDDLLKEFHSILCEKNNIKNLGLISTDSATYPLRKGVRGISTGSYGFNPIKSYIGKKDIFGREIKVSVVNISDSLASGAVFSMGEGSECTPICIIKNAGEIEFGDFKSEIATISPKDDIFGDVFKTK